MQGLGTHKRKYVLSGFLIALTGALLFSTKAVIVKHAFMHTTIDAVTLLALRMIFALPFYIGIAIFAERKSTAIQFSRKQWLYVILLGLSGYYLSSLWDFVGLQYISAGLERLILFLYPTFTVLFNAFIFKQKINSFQKWALLLTYSGIAIAYWGELHFVQSSTGLIKGSIYIFLCAITFAIYIVGSGRLIPQVGATKFTAYAMIASTVGVITHYAVQGIEKSHFTPQLLTYGIILGFFATVIPSFFISNGIKRIGANNVAILSSVGPVSTIIQAHFILGEDIFIEQIVGTVLVIIGVILIGWRNTTSPAGE